MNRRVLALAAVCLLAVGFVVGRASKRAVTETVSKETTVNQEVQRDSAGTGNGALRTSSTTDTKNDRVVTRVVVKPGGGRIITRWREATTQATQELSAQSVRIEYRDVEKQVIKTVEVEKRIEVPWRPRWTAMVEAGINWITPARTWGVGVAYRFLGPFSIGVVGNTHEGRLMLLGTF